MQVRDQYIQNAELRIRNLQQVLEKALYEIKNYKGEMKCPFERKSNETATEAYNRGLTMYDKFDETIKRNEKLLTTEVEVYKALDEVKATFIEFYEHAKNDRVDLADENNPLCDKLSSLAEQKKNEDIQKNQSQRQEIEKECAHEKMYWEGKKIDKTKIRQPPPPWFRPPPDWYNRPAPKGPVPEFHGHHGPGPHGHHHGGPGHHGPHGGPGHHHGPPGGPGHRWGHHW